MKFIFVHPEIYPDLPYHSLENITSNLPGGFIFYEEWNNKLKKSCHPLANIIDTPEKAALLANQFFYQKENKKLGLAKKPLDANNLSQYFSRAMSIYIEEMWIENDELVMIYKNYNGKIKGHLYQTNVALNQETLDKVIDQSKNTKAFTYERETLLDPLRVNRYKQHKNALKPPLQRAYEKYNRLRNYGVPLELLFKKMKGRITTETVEYLTGKKMPHITAATALRSVTYASNDETLISAYIDFKEKEQLANNPISHAAALLVSKKELNILLLDKQEVSEVYHRDGVTCLGVCFTGQTSLLAIAAKRESDARIKTILHELAHFVVRKNDIMLTSIGEAIKLDKQRDRAEWEMDRELRELYSVVVYSVEKMYPSHEHIEEYFVRLVQECTSDYKCKQLAMLFPNAMRAFDKIIEKINLIHRKIIYDQETGKYNPILTRFLKDKFNIEENTSIMKSLMRRIYKSPLSFQVIYALQINRLDELYRPLFELYSSINFENIKLAESRLIIDRDKLVADSNNPDDAICAPACLKLGMLLLEGIKFAEYGIDKLSIALHYCDKFIRLASVEDKKIALLELGHYFESNLATDIDTYEEQALFYYALWNYHCFNRNAAVNFLHHYPIYIAEQVSEKVLERLDHYVKQEIATQTIHPSSPRMQE